MKPLYCVLLTIVITLGAVAGDYFIKVASKLPTPYTNRYFFTGALIYALTSYGWVAIMPHMKLAYLGAVYSLTIVLGLCLLGVFVFHESLRPTEWIGFGLAIISLLLLYRVA